MYIVDHRSVGSNICTNDIRANAISLLYIPFLCWVTEVGIIYLGTYVRIKCTGNKRKNTVETNTFLMLKLAAILCTT